MYSLLTPSTAAVVLILSRVLPLLSSWVPQPIYPHQVLPAIHLELLLKPLNERRGALETRGLLLECSCRGARSQLVAVHRIQAGGYMRREVASNRRVVGEAARAPGLERRLCRQQQNSRGLETRLGEGPAAGGAARSGSSTASTESSCIPRCLGRRSYRRRCGKVADALCPHTPQSPTGREA